MPRQWPCTAGPCADHLPSCHIEKAGPTARTADHHAGRVTALIATLSTAATDLPRRIKTSCRTGICVRNSVHAQQSTRRTSKASLQRAPNELTATNAQTTKLRGCRPTLGMFVRRANLDFWWWVQNAMRPHQATDPGPRVGPAHVAPRGGFSPRTTNGNGGAAITSTTTPLQPPQPPPQLPPAPRGA